MTEQRTHRILSRVYDKSLKGEVAWQDTYHEGRFAVYLPDSAMTIELVTTFREPRYKFTITNERGTVVDEVIVASTDDAYVWVSELYELARKKALAVEARLDSVLTTIEKEGVVGEDEPPGQKARIL